MDKVICIIILLSFICVSCNTEIIVYNQNKNENNEIIVNKINIFKQNGLLDYLDDNVRAVCPEESTIEQMKYFVNNPEECINNIKKDEYGEKYLNILNAIYGESSIGEVYDAMYELSPSIANQYEESLISFSNSLDNDSTRTITDLSSIRDVNISFLYFSDKTSRKVDLSKSYNWGTVNGYVGAAAGAVAGFLMYKFGGFWTRIAGLVAGGVGVSAMGVIIGVWQYSTDWKIFQNLCISSYQTVKSIIDTKSFLSDKEKAKLFLSDLSRKLKEYLNKNPEAASQINSLLSFIDKNYYNFSGLLDAYKACFNHFNNNTEFAKKTVTVTTATVTVASASYLTGFSSVVNGWLKYLNDFIPDWLTITLDGIIISIKI